jgi:hypothetical protein
MDYHCSVCGKNIKEGTTVYIKHTEQHIVDIIKKKHPDWATENGLCQKCFDYYQREMKGEK